MPEARDVSQRTGLLTTRGKPKAWAREFHELAHALTSNSIAVHPMGSRPKLDWDRCTTSAQAGREFQLQYVEAFLRER